MKKLAPLVLLLLVLPLTAKAGVNRWTPFGRGDDTVLDLLLTPEGLYAITFDGRLFRSGDGGSVWEYLASVGRMVTADPANPRVMTAVTNYGDVYRSVDAGRSWLRLPRPVDEESSNPAVTSMKAAAGTIYVGGRSLYVSRDSGGTWSVTSPVAGSVRAMAVDPSKPRTVWFAAIGGLWKTIDAGKSFSLVIGNEGFTAVAVSPSRPATVYAGRNGRSYSSQDGGATWRPGGDPGVADLTALAVDPARPGRIYAAGLGGVASSQDGGTTWAVLGPRPVTSLIAARNGILFAGTHRDGLQVSRNRGRSWSREDRVGMGYPQATFIERDPRRGTLYLYHYTSGPGLLRSADDGRTWTPVDDISGDQLILYDLAVDRGNSAILYAVGPEGTFRIGLDGTMNRLPVSPRREMYTVATSGRAVLVGNSWAGYRSEDGGRTWKDVLPHVAGTTPGGTEIERSILDLVEDPLDSDTLYALTSEYNGGSSYVVLRSGDTGLHWTPIRSGDLDVLAVDPHDPGTLYSAETEADQTVLYESFDRGESWRPVGTIPGYPGGRLLGLLVDTKDPDVLWASNDLGVQRSEDGGRTWVRFNPGLARPRLTSIVKLAPDPAVPGRLYAMPQGGGLFELTTP